MGSYMEWIEAAQHVSPFIWTLEAMEPWEPRVDAKGVQGRSGL